MNEKPNIDYANLPYLSREGIQSEGNNRFLTRTLFLESSPGDKQHMSLWCLSEHEIYVPTENRWVPSAWLAYINAESEYDALMKICGNIRQWEAIKLCTWFKPYYEQWVEEQECLQELEVRRALLEGIRSGKAGYTAAAKQLMQMIQGKKSGRPKKRAYQDRSKKEDAVDKDAGRVAHLFGTND